MGYHGQMWFDLFETVLKRLAYAIAVEGQAPGARRRLPRLCSSVRMRLRVLESTGQLAPRSQPLAPSPGWRSGAGRNTGAGCPRKATRGSVRCGWPLSPRPYSSLFRPMPRSGFHFRASGRARHVSGSMSAEGSGPDSARGSHVERLT
jgi:hypothetical protein